MARFYHTKRRQEEIERLNRSVRSKKNRLKRLYDVTIDQEIKKLSDFKNSVEYNAYIKEMKKIADYNNYRYVELESGEVVPRDLIVELQRTTEKRNKANRKRLKKALKVINVDREEKLYLKDFDNDPSLFSDQLEQLRPQTTNFDEIKSRYQYGSSIERRIKQDKKVAEWSYDRYIRNTFYENFLKSVKTEWSGFPAHNLLIWYVKKKGSQWLYNQYIRGNIDPFEFVYKYEDYLRRFIATMTKFGFTLTGSGTGANRKDWNKPKN